MNLPDYDLSPIPIREDLADAHRKSWQQIGQPGSSWSAAERIRFVNESRRAASCQLCAARKTALSPVAIKGSHEHLGELPSAVVEVIHKMSTDPGRISRKWFDDVMSMGELTAAQYVEIVGVVATSVAITTFHEALGLGELKLPPPQAGDVSGILSDSVSDGEAWVPIMAEDNAEGTANIIRALALVPGEQESFWRVKRAHYMNSIARAMDETLDDALSRAQIEFIAARVSALNQCFY